MVRKIVPIVAIIAFILIISVGLFTPLGTYIPSINLPQGLVTDEVTPTPASAISQTVTSTATIAETRDCGIGMDRASQIAKQKAKDIGYVEYKILPAATRSYPPGTNMANLDLITEIQTYAILLRSPEDMSLGLMVFVDECGKIFHHTVVPQEWMERINAALPSKEEFTSAIVEIGEHHGYSIPSLGHYFVSGIIINKGDSPVTDIEITATFRDSDGKIVAIETGRLYLTHLLPGYEFPFRVGVSESELSKLIVSYSLEVSADISKSDDKMKTLKVVKSNFVMTSHSEYGEYKVWAVMGVIRNEGTADAKDTRVSVVFYDASGKLVGAGGIFDTQPGDIPVGNERSFSLWIQLPERVTVSSVIIYAE